MVKMFFREMEVKNLDMPFILIGDEKMKNLMFGKLEEMIEIFVAYLLSRYSNSHLTPSACLL